MSFFWRELDRKESLFTVKILIGNQILIVLIVFFQLFSSRNRLSLVDWWYGFKGKLNYKFLYNFPILLTLTKMVAFDDFVNKVWPKPQQTIYIRIQLNKIYRLRTIIKLRRHIIVAYHYQTYICIIKLWISIIIWQVCLKTVTV